MSTDNKPREFWIDPTAENPFDPESCSDEEMELYFGEALRKHPGQGPLAWQANLIHVIEYSAYSKLLAENKKYKEALEKIMEVLK